MDSDGFLMDGGSGLGFQDRIGFSDDDTGGCFHWIGWVFIVRLF